MQILYVYFFVKVNTALLHPVEKTTRMFQKNTVQWLQNNALEKKNLLFCMSDLLKNNEFAACFCLFYVCNTLRTSL